MADEGKDVGSVKSDSDTPTVNVEEATDGRNAFTDVVKGLDANRYATKKTVAQGMLDIALLTSNASQLKYVLQVGPKHEFYTLLVVLISISIVLQVGMGLVLLSLNLLHDCRFHLPRHKQSALLVNYGTTAVAFVVTVLNLLVGLLFVVIGGLDLNDHEDQPSAVVLNDVIVIFIFVISVINIVISAFGIEYSNSPLILERLKYINSEYLRKGNAISAIVAMVLSSILNINKQPDQRKAEILNDTMLAFKIISITVNIVISIFSSFEVDQNNVSNVAGLITNL